MGQLHELHRIAHRLKGSSRTLGARRMGNTCERLEKLPDYSSEKEIDSLVAQICHEFLIAAEALRSYPRARV